MKNEKGHYIVVLKNKTAAICKTIEEVNNVNPEIVQCILYAHYGYSYQYDKEKNTKVTDWYRYEFVNSAGEHINFRIGDFEVKYIGEDENGMTNCFAGRNVSIENHFTNEPYAYRSHKVAVEDFIHLEIIPLLNHLNNGSNDEEFSISLFKSYDTVVEEREQLRKEVNSLRKVIAGIKELCMPIDLSNL